MKHEIFATFFHMLMYVYCHFIHIVICAFFCFLLQLLGVGTSQGKLLVLSLDSSRGGAVCPVSVFVAHQPQPGKHDSRFGQLGKQYVM